MPSIRINNQASSANALQGLQFEELDGPALLSLYASSVTATDTVGLSVSGEQLLVDATPNLEVSADVVDTNRDAILVREPVPAGKLFMPVAATTAVNFLLVIEDLPG